jgi:two-component system sensor histidine kinase CreC
MLHDAFDEMRDALAGRNYVADYVQTLTHELKSPLSAIRGAAELLNDPAMPAEERRRFLANITNETQRIQQVVDRMMELTALEARRALDRVQDVSLRAVASEVVQSAGSGRDVRVMLDDGDDAVVQGDPFLLRLALTNLVENAIDFSPRGGLVRVSIQRNGDVAHLSVADQGPGVPDYARDKVFEKFYSLARPGTHRKSTGLGLSFVQRIAALHRGRARLANDAAGGAVATLSLPSRR